MPSRFVIAFLPKSKHLNFMAAVSVHSDFGAQENKVCYCFHFPYEICSAISNSFWPHGPCSQAGSSVHGIVQARILMWVAISFSREFFQPRDRTQVSHIAGSLFTVWATREAQVCHSFSSKEQASFNFVAAVSVHSDFGAQENKACLSFHFPPMYLPLRDGASVASTELVGISTVGNIYSVGKMKAEGSYQSCHFSAMLPKNSSNYLYWISAFVRMCGWLTWFPLSHPHRCLGRRQGCLLEHQLSLCAQRALPVVSVPPAITSTASSLPAAASPAPALDSFGLLWAFCQPTASY